MSFQENTNPPDNIDGIIEWVYFVNEEGKLFFVTFFNS